MEVKIEWIIGKIEFEFEFEKFLAGNKDFEIEFEIEFETEGETWKIYASFETWLVIARKLDSEGTTSKWMILVGLMQKI